MEEHGQKDLNWRKLNNQLPKIQSKQKCFQRVIKAKKISCIIENCWIYYLLLTCLLFYPGNISISLCIISGQKQVSWTYLKLGTCSRRPWSWCMSGSRHHLSTMASPWTVTLSFRVICMSILLLEVWWNFQLTFWPHFSYISLEEDTLSLPVISCVEWHCFST